MEPELKFQALAPERFGPLITENHCIICAACLSQKLGLWNRNLNYQLRLQPFKIAWAPAPQPWLSPRSFSFCNLSFPFSNRRALSRRYESIIANLCENLDTLDEPEARASMIWIIGEYAERIDNADELLESFLEGFHDENTQVPFWTCSLWFSHETAFTAC